ncbi:MAG: hypothetical protein AAF772_11315 [Acidobacteriota bacterium]
MPDAPQAVLPPTPNGDRRDDGPRTAVWVALRWPLAALLALAIVVGGLLWGYRMTLDQAARAAQGVGDLAARAGAGVRAVAEGFTSATITDTFLAALPTIRPTDGGRLELASAEVVETFTRTDERRVLWDVVPLGTTVSEIRVPVVYRYHLRLNDPWRLEIAGDTVVVYAPAIRPTLPAAIRTERMQKRVEADWLRFDADEQLLALERTITPQLAAYALRADHLARVQDAARQSVASFVQTWLLREGQWRTDGVRVIKVVFPPEADLPHERIGASIVLPRTPSAADRPPRVTIGPSAADSHDR